MLSSSLAILLATTAVSATPRPRDATADACSQISDAISSSSAIFYPGSEGYTDDIEHWATSSTQNATCSVEPGTAEDVAAIVGLSPDRHDAYSDMSGIAQSHRFNEDALRGQGGRPRYQSRLLVYDWRPDCDVALQGYQAQRRQVDC